MIVQKDDDGQEEIELSDDPHDVIALNTDNIPVLVTVSKVCYCNGPSDRMVPLPNP